MSLFKALKKWNLRKEESDLKRVRITSSGAFYMKSEDLFNDKQEALELLKKLNKSLDNYKKSSKDAYSHAD